MQHPLLLYFDVKSMVIEAGYGEEIAWQQDLRWDDVTEQSFLREAAWVILSSGMRESIIRRAFPVISRAFFQWSSSREIVDNRQSCIRTAMECFAHAGKISAIVTAAERIADIGFDSVRQEVDAHGVAYLRTYPYLGPATALHLAKNIGLSVAKPDRHLVRIAQAAGYQSPDELCAVLADASGDPVSVVDIVLWRFAVLNPQYEDYFRHLTQWPQSVRSLDAA